MDSWGFRAFRLFKNNRFPAHPSLLRPHGNSKSILAKTGHPPTRGVCRTGFQRLLSRSVPFGACIRADSCALIRAGQPGILLFFISNTYRTSRKLIPMRGLRQNGVRITTSYDGDRIACKQFSCQRLDSLKCRWPGIRYNRHKDRKVKPSTH